ncbi:hypothetical protein EGT74_24390 [Chitinophaga lutea]|uniref:Uncharacterized protein n=1 Tax=Chitinophaga lutea TaxID=2488634 RepID=A0A3N4PBB4_9BACT|nr:hypothetical protein EGT74_24390 [Chitinophaga lutea]
MIDRGQQFKIITGYTQRDGKDYPIQLDLEIWSKDEGCAEWLVWCMRYTCKELAQFAEKEEWHRPFKFKPTFN